MVDACWLVHNGVPWDRAFNMPDTMRTALAIIFSGFQGRKFDWQRWDYEPEPT